ncbi:MAG: hypothetical protein GXY06_01030 [Clostridiaceae bacterium]|nr:hypothetical protein [Clostridiaceae bacterium]
MQKAKKLFALVLVLVMGFSLAACGKKPIDSDDFEDIMDDLDYNVYEESDPGKKIDEAWYAYDDDYEYVVMLQYYEDKDDAKDEIDDMIEDIEEAKKEKDFDGKIKKSGMGSYKKIVVNGEFEDDVDDFYGEMYAVIIRSDEMILMVAAQDTGKSDIKEVDKVVKELGY